MKIPVNIKLNYPLCDTLYKKNKVLIRLNHLPLFFIFLQQQEQLKGLKRHHDEEIDAHEREIRRHQEEIARLKKRVDEIDDMAGKKDSDSD